MAIKILDETRRPGTPLGVRLDDAVRARRDARRREATLRVVPRVQEKPGDSRERSQWAARPAAPAVMIPSQCDRIRPQGDAAIAPARPQPARTAVPAHHAPAKTDPMFDADVEQARTLATTVRRDVRKAARPVAAVTPAPARPGRLRLTLRGQRVLVALGFALSIALGGLVGTIIGTEPLPEHTATVVVKPGESLWSIAESISEPGRDVRPVMEQIAALNGLQSPVLTSGQTLVVPAE